MLLYRCQIGGRLDPPLYARVWLYETMWGYPLHFNYCAFTSISLLWQFHEAVLYIARFAIRNNNLFYRFSKIEAGGGPETKHFIGVALLYQPATYGIPYSITSSRVSHNN